MKKGVRTAVVSLLMLTVLMLLSGGVTAFTETDITADSQEPDKGGIPVNFMFYNKLIHKTKIYGPPGEPTTKRDIYDYFKKNQTDSLAGYTFSETANGGQPVQFPAVATRIPDSKALQIMLVLDGTPPETQSRIDLIFYAVYDKGEESESDTAREKTNEKTKIIDRQTVEGTPGEVLAEDINTWLDEQAYTVIGSETYTVDRVEGVQIFPEPGGNTALHVYLKHKGPASEEDRLRKKQKRINSAAVMYLVDQRELNNPLGGVTTLGEAGKPIDTEKLSVELKRDLSYRKILKDYDYVETLDSRHRPLNQNEIVYPSPREEGVTYVMVFKSKGVGSANQEIGQILWPTPFTGDRSPVALGVLLSTVSFIALIVIQNKRNS